MRNANRLLLASLLLAVLATAAAADDALVVVTPSFGWTSFDREYREQGPRLENRPSWGGSVAVRAWKMLGAEAGFAATPTRSSSGAGVTWSHVSGAVLI